MQVADFGCGHGYFSLPLAKAVNQGFVYACDVMEDALEAVKSQAKLEKIFNIKTIRCNLEVLGNSKLSDNSIDLVVLANILYQTKNKSEIIKEAKRILKPGGQIVLIDWIGGATLAPKDGWLLTKEEARPLFENEGLAFDKELNIDSQHYALAFRKNP